MEYNPQIIKSVRKTISIQIDQQAQIIVRAPKSLKNEEIQRFIKKHDLWIKKNLVQAQQKMSQSSYATFEEGSFLYYFGEKYTVEHKKLHRKTFEFEEKFIINSMYVSSSKKIIVNWYKKQALLYAQKRTAQICKDRKIEVGKIKISGASTRWGSCSGKNNINLNWRLVMAPENVFDYVIYHELAHVFFKDHSRNFWSKVAFFDPNYKKHEKWLKENGHLLSAF